MRRVVAGEEEGKVEGRGTGGKDNSSFKSLEANSSQSFFSLLRASPFLSSSRSRESARRERRITSGYAPLSERTSCERLGELIRKWRRFDCLPGEKQRLSTVGLISDCTGFSSIFLYPSSPFSLSSPWQEKKKKTSPDTPWRSPDDVVNLIQSRECSDDRRRSFVASFCKTWWGYTVCLSPSLFFFFFINAAFPTIEIFCFFNLPSTTLLWSDSF